MEIYTDDEKKINLFGGHMAGQRRWEEALQKG